MLSLSSMTWQAAEKADDDGTVVLYAARSKRSGRAA